MPSPDAPWHSLPAEAVCQRLGVAPAEGLPAQQAAQRLIQHGANTLPQNRPKPVWKLLGRQFLSPLIYVLLIAAALAAALGRTEDAFVIMTVIVLNAIIGAFQEGRAQHSMESLRRLASLRVRVLRSGKEELIEGSDLVPGDVMFLSAGDAVSADSRIIEAAAFEVSEAALTGESLPVSKTGTPLAEDRVLAERTNMVYAGTHVTAGRAKAVVVDTGIKTEVGKIARMTTQTREPQTPLEIRIDQFGRQLLYASAGLFAVVLAAGLARGIGLADILMVAISQTVSLVPEGLPVALTIALAVGMQRMAAHGAVVRRLAAVETLGLTTVICSDKTGTLTRNEITVTEIWLPDGREVQVTGAGYTPQGALFCDGRQIEADTDDSFTPDHRGWSPLQ